MAKKGPCWEGYQMVGMKIRMVEECLMADLLKNAQDGKCMDDDEEYGEKKYNPIKTKNNILLDKMPKMSPGEYNYKKKNKVIEAFTGEAIRQPSETNKEFEMRHEYHTATKGMKDYYKDII
jgi:hypothetical protein